MSPPAYRHAMGDAATARSARVHQAASARAAPPPRAGPLHSAAAPPRQRAAGAHATRLARPAQPGVGRLSRRQTSWQRQGHVDVAGPPVARPRRGAQEHGGGGGRACACSSGCAGMMSASARRKAGTAAPCWPRQNATAPSAGRMLRSSPAAATGRAAAASACACARRRKMQGVSPVQPM